MAEVTDADGVRWSVYRRWGYRYWNAMDGSSGEEAAGGLIINLLQFVVISPIWLIAKGFGAPWTIVIERNGTEVREVKVRGWRNSERCIQELAESVADGDESAA